MKCMFSRLAAQFLKPTLALLAALAVGAIGSVWASGTGYEDWTPEVQDSDGDYLVSNPLNWYGTEGAGCNPSWALRFDGETGYVTFDQMMEIGHYIWVGKVAGSSYGANWLVWKSKDGTTSYGFNQGSEKFCIADNDGQEARLKIESGRYTTATESNTGRGMLLGSGTGTADFWQTGGELIVNGKAVMGGGSGTCSVTLEGGVFAANTITRDGGTGTLTFTLNGGTIKSLADSSDFIASGISITVGSNGGTIDTGANASTVATDVSGAGTIVKQGAGVLTFSATPTSSVLFKLREGTLVLPSDYAGSVSTDVSGCEVVRSSDGTTYTVERTSYADADVASAAEITSSKAVAIDVSSDAQFIGTVNTKGLTKNGSGSLTLFGQNTIAGSVVINSGVLKLAVSPRVLSGVVFDFDASYNSDVLINTEGVFSWKDASGGSISLSSDGTVSPSLQKIGEMNYVASEKLRVWTTMNTKPEMLYMVWRLNGVGGGWPAPVRNNTNNANNNWRITVPKQVTSSGSQDYRIEGSSSTDRTTSSIWSNGNNPAAAIVDTTQLLTVGDSRWYRSDANSSKKTWFASDYNAAIGEILGFTEVMTDSQRNTVNAYLMNKWGINNTAWSVDYSEAEVTVASGATLDLGGGAWTVDSLSASGTGTATVQNGTLTITAPISLSDGQILRIPANSTYTLVEGVRATTADGVTTLSANTAAARVGDTSFPTVQDAINALVDGSASGTLTVYESATVSVSNVIAGVTVDLQNDATLSFTQIAPFNAKIENGVLTSNREAATYVYVGSGGNVSALNTSGNYTLNGIATDLVPTSIDTLAINSVLTFTQDAEILVATIQIYENSIVTISGGSDSRMLRANSITGAGKLILGNSAWLASATGTASFSCEIEVTAETASSAANLYVTDTGREITLSGVLSGSGYLKCRRGRNKQEYSGTTFNCTDTSRFTGTIEAVHPADGDTSRDIGRNYVTFKKNCDLSKAKVILPKTREGDYGQVFVSCDNAYERHTFKFGSLNGYLYEKAADGRDNYHQTIEVGALNLDDTITGCWKNNGNRNPYIRKVGYGTFTTTATMAYGYILNDGVLRVLSTDGTTCTSETDSQEVLSSSVTENDVTYAVYSLKYAAKVGDTLYETMASAINAVGTADATITLMQSYTGAAIPLVPGQTLNLNGFKCVNAPIDAVVVTVVPGTGVVSGEIVDQSSYISKNQNVYKVQSNTEVTITWTAAQGYEFAGGQSTATTVISPTENVTPECPAATAVVVGSVSISAPEVGAYGNDFATVTVTAGVTSTYPAATTITYTLKANGTAIATTTAAGDATSVTFTDANVSSLTRYGNISYTVEASGESVTAASSDATTAMFADTIGWVNENFQTTTTTAAGGAWQTAVTYDSETHKAAVVDNRFSATNCTTGDVVTVTIDDVVYTGLSDLTSADTDAQGAVAVGGTELAPKFMLLTKQGDTVGWYEAAGVTPVLETGVYDIVMTFDYINNTYTVTVNDTPLTVGGAAAVPLAKAQTSVKDIDFLGAGSLAAVNGVQYEGKMAIDQNGRKYATVAEALEANASVKGAVIKLLHGSATTSAEGWNFDSDTKTFVKKVIGLIFLAF